MSSSLKVEMGETMCGMERLVTNLEHQLLLAVKREAVGPSQLKKMYVDEEESYHFSFPKQCRACGAVYETHSEYLTKTTKSVISNEPIVMHNHSHAVEYRDCLCGNTLMLTGECRRDSSPFGVECRAYFDVCVQRLINENGFSLKDAEALSRVIFRSVLSQAGEESTKDL